MSPTRALSERGHHVIVANADRIVATNKKDSKEGSFTEGTAIVASGSNPNSAGKPAMFGVPTSSKGCKSGACPSTTGRSDPGAVATAAAADATTIERASARKRWHLGMRPAHSTQKRRSQRWHTLVRVPRL